MCLALGRFVIGAAAAARLSSCVGWRFLITAAAGGTSMPGRFATQSTTTTYPARRRILQGGLIALAAVPLTGLAARLAAAAETAVVIPAPAMDAAAVAGGLQTAVLAGGCFWGVQAVYQHTKGVTKALSGYAGGQKDTAHYEMVGTGRTGHAESVSITYDPQQISYGKILQIYFSVAHNPTELNRQGPDFGTQYRSAIFYADDEQKRIASAYVAQLQQAHVFAAPIVTKLEQLSGFYPAEDYHQDFLVLHPSYPYIVFNDLPKLDNLKQVFPDYYREIPVTVLASSRPGQ
jgi:peptide-methionine (S)-S-oxide reductase